MNDRRGFRLAAAMILAAALNAPAFARAGDEDAAAEKPARYENPIVSLLFLPVTLLVKMASVFEPEGGAGSSARAEASDD